MAQTSYTYGPSVPALAIIAHILLEVPAGLNFILRPGYTLSATSNAALPVIRQYGLLLIVLNIILGLLLLQFCQSDAFVATIARIIGIELIQQDGSDNLQLMSRICGILTIYHLLPFFRAIRNARQFTGSRASRAYGGPMIIAALHGIVGSSLFGAWWSS